MTATTFNLERLIRANVAQLKPYSSARDEFKDFHEDMVFLDANENPFENGVNRYPDPQQLTLKQHLSSLKRVPVDQILLGNGSDEVLDLNQFSAVGVIKNSFEDYKNEIEHFRNQITKMKQNQHWTKNELVELFHMTIKNFDHIETGKNLDGKM